MRTKVDNGERCRGGSEALKKVRVLVESERLKRTMIRGQYGRLKGKSDGEAH